MTDIQPIAGGRPAPNTAMVSADQVTILGNGTTDLPLRAGGGGSTFLAEFLGDDSFPPAVGQPVSLGFGTPSVGVARVILSIGFPVAGIIIALEDVVIDGSDVTATATIQSQALVTLTADAWDEVTGDSGGLTPGAAYYLDPTTLGFLTTTKPVGIGEFVAQIGVAVTATELAIFLPVAPIAN